jgi:glutamate dehydrogenase
MAIIESDDQRAARARIEDAVTALCTVRTDIPASFVTGLFGSVVPEDVLRYEPGDLARLAESAWGFLAERKPGTPKIRIEPYRAQAARERSNAVAVIEIVNDDMPFLVDSVLGELTEQGVDVRLVAHPIFTVERDSDGTLTLFHGIQAQAAGVARESVIHIEIGQVDDARREALIAGIGNALEQIRLAVSDWRSMVSRVGEVIADLKASPPPLPVDEIAEAIQFLQWLVDDNFVFLGIRSYRLSSDEQNLEPRFDSSLGILRSPEVRVLRRGQQHLEITPQIMAFLKEPRALIIAKANMRSRVHRRTYLDYVGVKRYDPSGRLTGEFRIVGLFTSTAYTRAARTIPYLRRKVAAVEKRAGFDPKSHSGKALSNVLETFPRDELFQIDEDTLLPFALSILQLEEHPRVRVLARRDRFDRFVSVQVYVPRERYDSRVRAAIGDYLASVFIGHVSAFYPFFPEGPLTRVHFIIGRADGATPNVERAVLEQAVAAIVRTWADGLSDALALLYDPAKTRSLLERYRPAFSPGYQDSYSPSIAVSDIRVIEGLTAERPLGVDFHHRNEEEPGAVGLKVWSFEHPLPLSERVPVLENMGFRVVDERTYEIAPREGTSVWFHDMLLERSDGGAIALDVAKSRLEAAFLMVMRRGAENDGYNALVLTGGLMWREVALIRTISRFLRQIRVPYSQDYLWTTLRNHASIAADIVALFHARFDPRAEGARTAKQDEILARIGAALEAVQSLDEDRILRHFVNAVTSAIRTNFYQLDSDGQPKPLIAIKFDSRKLDDLPLPRPLYEIFVYSPRVEGVHLRFGKVARGGIRWSDRPQDFRTEILGLVKAQQVKNAVIVPVGAKGGFVPKQMPAGGSREAMQAEGVAAYKLFISTLLDITDNLGTDGVIPPRDVIRHDDDDPYLVVAADKGTATFSDTANALAIEHGYWLGDAFASGGSAGYDHKVMGITARGAWESVKRHFREMDINISATPFTAVGVGDMSGDVFGNGMIRENTIKLIAAFDHRDIFIDPDPDPKKSFLERARMFKLPRSSWQDYDRKLISAGGGVFSRSAKEISLSAEAQRALGLSGDKHTPQQIMRAILKAKVDLLWFGGIGTYVRASTEGDDQAGDRANDAIRVTPADLGCKVIGEGANLGMTQRGRVEAAFRGIRLNTDAIDNSAGVNTSDVEVNIKIAASLPVRDGRLTTETRNTLLAKMTEEVGTLVLRNNYLQTLALSLAQGRGLEDLGFQQRLMQTLEQRGELDRSVEFLPDDKELTERRKRGQGLTRPELAVLLAYAKLSLYSELLDSAVPDDPYLGRELGRYFPKEIAEKFPDALEKHRLRREIIATQLANSMINRGGPTLTVRIADQTGSASPAIAAAFAAVRDSYGMTALNGDIDALDNKVTGKAQLELYATVENLLLDRLVWFLRNVDLGKGLAGIVQHYADGIAKVGAALDTALSKDELAARVAREGELTKAGVPGALARRVANLPLLRSAPDIVLIADRASRSIADVTATYFAASAFFQVDRIAGAAQQIVVADYFDRLALDRALDSIGDAERRLTAAMVGNGAAGVGALENWVKPRAHEVERIRSSIHEIAGSGLTLSKLSVAASLLGDLARQ